MTEKIMQDNFLYLQEWNKYNPQLQDALFIEEGSVNLSGNLILNDHNHGVRLGYASATTDVISTLTLMESAVLTIQNNIYLSCDIFQTHIPIDLQFTVSKQDCKSDGTKQGGKN